MERMGVDFAAGIPSSTSLHTGGFDFAVRYCINGGPELPGKLIQSGELLERYASDISVCLVHEKTSDRALGGFPAGVVDAQDAQDWATRISFPDWRPIYFAVDFDATVPQQAIIDQYLIGAASEIGLSRVGVYGGFYVVKRCALNGTAKWFWQTQAWSGGIEWEGNHILQLANQIIIDGTECDTNVAKQDDFGQWDRSMDMMNDVVNDMWAQMTGNSYTTPPHYDGWPTDAGNFTMVDMLRWLITNQRATNDHLAAMQTKLNSLT